MQFRWGAHDQRHQRPAVRVHPASGVRVRLNQADQFHPSNQRPEMHEAMQALYEDCEDEMLQNATFKDGGAMQEAY